MGMRLDVGLPVGDEGRRCRWGMVVVAALGFVTMLVGGIGAAPVGAEWGASVVAGQLTLRAEPGVWAEPLGTLWEGEYVAILDGPTADDWYKVDSGGRVGWVAGAYLDLGGTGGTAEWEAPSEWAPADEWAPAAEWAAATGGWERWVDIDRSAQTVTLYEGDQAVATYWGAMGADPSADGFFATAVGTYYVYEKNADLSWTNYAQAWIEDWVGFDPNRANGFHSYTMDASGWVLPNGAAPTGGCVALEPTASARLFDFVAVGTRVEVRW